MIIQGASRQQCARSSPRPPHLAPDKYEEGCSFQSHPSPCRPLPPEDMNPISTRTLLLLLCFVSLVAAAIDFTRRLDNFGATNKIGGVDSDGYDVPAAKATGLKYETRREECGTTADSFNWAQFARLFTSWLLPWLVLISQLPFGSGNLRNSLLSS